MDANEYQREYQRKRRLDENYREKQRIYYREWYQENGRNRADDYAEAILEWRQEHPDRVKAGVQLREAIKKGEIRKPTECQRCGRIARLVGHHDDYSKPLDVIWLCYSCHKLEHRLTKQL
jgi:hypothetical protein